MTYAYLGPEGTFTQAALCQLLPPGPKVAHQPFPTVPAALEAARQGECEGAIVPLENSVRGVVPATMDQLVRGDVHINAEVEVPITFALMAPEGVTLDEVTRVHSHPHALAQCERWLADQLPHARVQVAAAAGTGDAAIAALLAAEVYGLCVLATGLGVTGAVTRFVSLATSWTGQPRARRSRTSLLVPSDTSPLRLADVLNEFRAVGVGLAWVQPWPTGERLGSYHMFVDLEAHVDDLSVQSALDALRVVGLEVYFLGSYPRWSAGS
jgi:prephenate dehydratase